MTINNGRFRRLDIVKVDLKTEQALHNNRGRQSCIEGISEETWLDSIKVDIKCFGKMHRYGTHWN